MRSGRCARRCVSAGGWLACLLVALLLVEARAARGAGEVTGPSPVRTPSDARPAERPPNILLIIADDVGVDQVGAYRRGAGDSLTPNIDAFARRGVLFRNVWSNPVCSSTRATILTGRHGFRTGVGFVARAGEELRDREHTLAELLAHHPTAPYETAAFGKWHLTAGRGWEPDERILSAPYRAGFGVFRGVFKNILGDYQNWREVSVRKAGPGRPVVVSSALNLRYNTSVAVDRAAAWIRDSEARHPDSPWFVWLAFNAAHRPFHKPPAGLHRQRLDDPALTCSNPAPFSTPGNLAPCYRAMIEAMDTEIGRLWRQELSSASRERTTLVFLADNGSVKEVMANPRAAMRAKGTPYQGGIHVPLVIAGSGVDAPTGRESDELVNTSDLFATLLELSGVDVAAHVPGRFSPRASPSRDRDMGVGADEVVLDSISLLPVLAPGAASTAHARREFAYAELFKRGGPDPLWPAARAIRDVRGYKLIRFLETRAGRGHEELYDLAADPNEQHDLLASGLYEEAGAALARLRERLDTIGSSGWRPRGAPLAARAAVRDQAVQRSQ